MGTEPAEYHTKPDIRTQEKARRINYMLDFFQPLDLAILVQETVCVNLTESSSTNAEWFMTTLEDWVPKVD